MDDVAAATGGRLEPAEAAGTALAGPATLDSRRVAPGDLFVAVKGAHVDGADFAAAAVAAGAGAVLAERGVAGVPTVVVHDVVPALGRLAHAWLDRVRGAGPTRVTAVTGSSGKTTTKDLLAAVLARSGSTVAPPGSYNNELGVPLTVLATPAGTAHLVLEMGARGPGHIAELTRVARPDVAVVLNVGAAHVGEFGSRERTAQAKGELVEALPAEGVAVLNADDPLVAAMATRTSARVVTYGATPDAQVRAQDVRLDSGRAHFELCDPEGGTAPVALRLVGAHQVGNALAAASVGLVVGLPVDVVADALSTAEPASRWRMELTTRADGTTVLNDAYNANPDSARAALEALVAVADGRRTWAVLGEMLELGDTSADEHEALGRLAAAVGVDRLVVVGPGARPAHAGASLAPTWVGESVVVDDVDAAVALLVAEVRAGDVVLVKASRASGLERVAAALLDEDPDPEHSEPAS